MKNYITTTAGVRMPKILYGTAWKKSDTERLVTTALCEGFSGIDTACQPKHYNEAGVGAAVSAFLSRGVPRSDLYLQTKFTSVSGQDPKTIPYDPRAALPEQVLQSFGVSLRNLQTEYLDGLILHSPLPTDDQTLEVWRALESLVNTGGVRQLGISNCYDLRELESLYDSATIKPAVLQNRFYADTRYDREIRSFCRRRQIVYQSFWTLSANPQILAHPSVGRLVTKYKATPAQILFRYLTLIDVVPLTGTRSEVHLREDLSIFEFDLTPAERDSLTSLF
jgi:diketogulonate reductase-like aldo/keto reductase